jgi:protein-S-isoprenylcysteine O-methyltransferase Ste14
MELIPSLALGWLNGWIPILILYLALGIVRATFPKDVVVRIWDKSGRSRRRKVSIYMGALLSMLYFGLAIFTPLKLGSGIFIAGSIVYGIGLAGFLAALFNFRNTPPNQPVTRGLYRISRHPQQVMFFVAFLGISIAIGSWIALILEAISSVFLHARVLAEEEACLERYGDDYRAYMKRVPRYFLFF